MRSPVSIVIIAAALALAACGGSSAPEPAAATAPSEDVSKDEVAEPQADCDGLDQFTCEITGGCAWSAGSKSCGKQ